MATTVDWTKHRRQADRCAPRMLKAMKALARQVGVNSGLYGKHSRVDGYHGDHDYRVEFVIERPSNPATDPLDTLGRNKLGVSLSLWDSGDADDGIYGQHGNFVFDMVEEGGRMVGGVTPENYTDRVWVDYDDDEEFDRRLEGVIAGLDEAARMIEAWKIEAR